MIEIQEPNRIVVTLETGQGPAGPATLQAQAAAAQANQLRNEAGAFAQEAQTAAANAALSAQQTENKVEVLFDGVALTDQLLKLNIIGPGASVSQGAPGEITLTVPGGNSGDGSGTGVDGDDGWSPVFSVVSDGQRRVLRVVDWTGGAGTKPAVGSYLGATGFVATVVSAVDIRGDAGNNGWSPVFSVVTDGVRRVLQVTDWAGGAGTKPAVGSYLSASGFVATAAAAVDVRGDAGSAGTNGWSPIFAVASDGLRRVLQLVDWTGGTGTKPAVGSYLGAGGFVATAAAAVDVRGIEGLPGDNGLSGWTSVLAVVADGERRVFQVVDWVGGTGTKPSVGLYVGSTGLVSLIASAVDVRGAAGTGGTGGGAGYSLAQLAIDVDGLATGTAADGDFDIVVRGGPTPGAHKVPSITREVINARGSRSNLNDRISIISDLAGTNLAPPVVGRYYDNGFTPANLSGTLSLAANRFTAVPYVTPHRWRIDRLGFQLTTAATSGLYRCFIYAANLSDLLATSQLFAGALELDISTAGFKEHILDFIFEPDVLYWIGMNGNFTGTTPAIRSLPVGSGKGFGPVAAGDTAYRTGFAKTNVLSTDPLPALAPVVESDLTALGNQLPLFRMRAAAL